MARVLYGVHGTGSGHAMRALAVARRFPEHEFLFVSHGTGAALVGREYRVVECPNPETPVCAHRVDVPVLMMRNLKVFARQRQLVRRVLEVVDRFRPEAAITDYEYFVPRACRRAGIPCLSLDHQHIVTCSSHGVPRNQLWSYFATSMAIRGLFSEASHFIVTSFYRPPLKKGSSGVQLLPPLLRDSVLKCTPRNGGHVLAYHGYQTFRGFYEFLRTLPRPVVVYGCDSEFTTGNLRFKKHSEQGFLEDLASCSYVVAGGGHTLSSEALHLGKPLMLFPIKGAFEQFLNACYVERLGYGRCLDTFTPPKDCAADFEAALEQFRVQVGTGVFCGNDEIVACVRQFIRSGALPSAEGGY